MDPAVRDEWVRRLRSGDYPQGGGQLRSSSGRFCCLGVLCEVAADHGVVVYDHDEGGYVGVGWLPGAPYVGHLPPPVQRWAGLVGSTSRPNNPVVRDTSLSNWNDRGTSFADIATMIEEEL
jgi:hypothetical protein